MTLYTRYTPVHYTNGAQPATEFQSGPHKPGRRRGTGGVAPLLTDAQILELRALHEFAGWTRRAIAARYDMAPKAMDRYLNYITRALLVPKPHHVPPEFRRAQPANA